MSNTILAIEEQQQWAMLKNAGLQPGVESLSDYKRLTALGLTYAQVELCQGDAFPCSTDSIKQAHKCAFEDVDPMAGKFRKQVGCFGGYVGAEPHRVDREVELLEAQSGYLFDKARTPTEILEATAFSHARFVRIHPFKDGNGRISRAHLFAHLREGMQVPMDMLSEHIADNKKDYIKAMGDSFKSNDLTPLMGFLKESIEYAHPALGEIPIPESNPSPFTLLPDMKVKWGETREFSDDLALSKNSEYFSQERQAPFAEKDQPQPKTGFVADKNAFSTEKFESIQNFTMDSPGSF